jgi:hypothetical protein
MGSVQDGAAIVALAGQVQQSKEQPMRADPNEFVEVSACPSRKIGDG